MDSMIASRIEKSAGDLAAETGWEFVSVTALRERLSHIARADLDRVLVSLYCDQRVNLVPQSAQQLLTRADREAAVHVGGEDKHLVSWG